jgi:hypothetical protein
MMLPDNFLNDKLLVEMGLESYIGAPVVTVKGKLSGILVPLDDTPIRDTDF